ncbi:MAG: hypothetical protein U1C46_06000 [Bacteroidales bacterium]|nr:hypothetical protein [Bacteroidales bacterium]MDZ4204352.1 hypothetical protein [Bacteroidales bacterium]
MKRLKYWFLVFVFGISVKMAFSQTVYLTEKQGAYSYYNNTKSKGNDYITFGTNVKTLSDYFHQNTPVMKANKGFDLSALLTGYWDDEYKTCKWNYGLRGELNFDFQLFLKENGKEGKWTVEPPHWQIDINNTETGHGGMLNEGNESSFLKELFAVFPRVKEIAPGVNYYDCEHRTCGSLVVFNPDRPLFWLPVTVREIAEAKLKYYNENEKMLYDFIKPLVDKMSEAELNASAFNQSNDGILKLNGKGEGLQIMRFNPDYWDKSLPPSAVQLLTFIYYENGYACLNKEDQEKVNNEYVQNNGHPNYIQEVSNSLKINELNKLIQKK